MADGCSREVGGLVSLRCMFRVAYCVTASLVQPSCGANARLRPSRDQGACFVDSQNAESTAWNGLRLRTLKQAIAAAACQSHTFIRPPRLSFNASREALLTVMGGSGYPVISTLSRPDDVPRPTATQICWDPCGTGAVSLSALQGRHALRAVAIHYPVPPVKTQLCPMTLMQLFLRLRSLFSLRMTLN
jgi:hypothetical protein